MRRIGPTLDRVLANASADGGAVAPARRVGIGAVNLLDSRVIHAGAKGLFHRDPVGAVAVRRDLDALAGESIAKVVGQDQRTFRTPIADEIGDHQLRISIERRPRPHVPSAFRSGLGVGDVARLRVAERPDFIDLHAF